MTTFLFVLLVLFFLARFVLPVVLRLVVGNFVKQQARRYGQGFGGAQPFEGGYTEPQRPTNGSGSSVHVDYVPPRQKPRPSKDFKGGEYVEFEEVK
ncbi:DUF4834 family protein [Hymenobacter mucosus]|uniref:DUF4834 domain-containing protein n=1 Tax=Hymenobacter mucosus TaxID=1411120 RepID=A0A238Z2M9_9BACT|nr:DUF4834 family protein [Hymenobacter mucosus]SNR77119.1 protein of unknown function [Hymenobacter mucosus]